MHATTLFAAFTLLSATLIGAYDPVKMLCLVNKERVRGGLKPLGLSKQLEQAAQKHSDDQARMRSMGHNGSDGSSPGDRVERAGYNWRSVAENVAYGYSDEEECMRQWMNSSGHRQNIMGGSYTHFGSAVSKSGSTPYYTQNFAGDGQSHNFPECPSGSDYDTSSGGSSPSSDYGDDSPSGNYGGGSSPSPSSDYGGGSSPTKKYGGGGSSPSKKYGGGSSPSKYGGGGSSPSGGRRHKSGRGRRVTSYGGDLKDTNDTSDYGNNSNNNSDYGSNNNHDDDDDDDDDDNNTYGRKKYGKGGRGGRHGRKSHGRKNSGRQGYGRRNSSKGRKYGHQNSNGSRGGNKGAYGAVIAY